jgi:hypothetical protein
LRATSPAFVVKKDAKVKQAIGALANCSSRYLGSSSDLSSKLFRELNTCKKYK